MKINRPWLENTEANPTIRTLWTYLLSPSKEVEPWKSAIAWPPDVFALCAAVLRRCGAYTAASPSFQYRKRWSDDSEKGPVSVGQKWAALVSQGYEKLLQDPQLLHPALREAWEDITQKKLDTKLHGVADDPALLAKLVFLLSSADEAGQGLGIPFQRLSRPREKTADIADVADELLRPTQFGSTLCMKVPPATARVLPKVHTAKPGLTLRSFSHYLSYCETDEVQPQWYFIPSAGGDKTNTFHFNVLVVPWPRVAQPAQIKAIDHQESWGHFEYEPYDSRRDVAGYVTSLCEQARAMTGAVDAVVMPELALGVQEYRAVREAVLRQGLVFVAGVGGKEPNGTGENRLCIDVPLSSFHYVHLRQRKHHRWRLERRQIEQYGLAARLDRTKWYWEHIDLRDRKLMFFALRPWLVSCAVICEDLARHDPVSELVRGVGPHLLLALLMDGPQLDSRWSSRYAASLADDPGSSVLCVTSLGMSQLSRPTIGMHADRSRVIALWRDAKFGTREIELPNGHEAVLLTLCCEPEIEHTADGRPRGGSDEERKWGGAYTTVLAGWHPIKAAQPSPSATQVAASRPYSDIELKCPVVIGAREASVLAQLAQSSQYFRTTAVMDTSQPDGRVPRSASPKHAPVHLKELQGEAFHIGCALWEAMAEWDKWVDNELVKRLGKKGPNPAMAVHDDINRSYREVNKNYVDADRELYKSFVDDFLRRDGSAARRTAVAIQEWARTNYDAAGGNPPQNDDILV